MSWVPEPHVAGSRGILYSKPAAQELPCLGFLRRMLPVPARQSIGKLQRRNFHVLGSCTAGCRFLHGSPWGNCIAGTFTHFGLYNINKWRSVGGTVVSIVCHVLAQSVCTDRDSNAPNRKIRFPVFFFPSGAFLELLKTLVVSILGDFHMFFCVMGLEGDTVCINNATHLSRPG